MTWTTEKPTVPGWYWFLDCRTHPSHAKPLYYAESDIKALVYHGSSVQFFRWSGPIPAPEEE